MAPLCDLKEAARLLRVSIWTVRAYVKAGKLNPIRFGRRVLLEESELERFIEVSKSSSAGSDAQNYESAESRRLQ